MNRRAGLGALLAGSFLLGCNQVPEDSGSGAKECVRDFFQAIISEDWQIAYGKLTPESHKAVTLEQFSGLAVTYRSKLGFEPNAFHIQSCQEQGRDAIAHVVLTGRSTDRERRYKDAITLRRCDDGWRIVLPWNFGKPTTVEKKRH
jgi:hypothetical protein